MTTRPARTLWAWAAALAVAGCDTPQFRVDGDPVDGRVVSPDAGFGDAAADDAAADDAGLDASPDSAPPDAAVRDAALDAGSDDAGTDAQSPDADLDAAQQDAAPAVVTGQARAADERIDVSVCAGDVCGVTVDGVYTVGPLPPGGPVTWTFTAPDHATETLTVPPGEAPEAVYLYRGVRIADRVVDLTRAFFGFDGARLFLVHGDRLDVVPTQAPPYAAPTTLVPDHFEVYLTNDPANTGALVRRNIRPAQAGDLTLYPFDGGPPRTLFEQAQPWVRFQGGRALAMTFTSEAYSTLASNREDADRPQAAVPLGAQVPWLLVASLSDGRVAWVDGRGDVAQVFVSQPDGEGRRAVSAPGAAADLLMTTPDGRGLLWRSVDGALWRATSPEAAPERLVEDALASPRPWFRPSGALMVAAGPPASASILRLDPVSPGAAQLGPPVRRVDDLDAARIIDLGRAGYVAQASGEVLHLLWDTDDAPWRVGQAARLEVASGAATGDDLVLLDGVAVQVSPGARRVDRLGLDGLSALQAAPSGATAWRADDRALVYLRPIDQGAPVTLARGAAAPGRLAVPGAQRLIVRGAEGWSVASLPSAELTPLDAPVERAVVVDAALALGLGPAPARPLRAFDTTTGTSYGWARGVTHLEVGPRPARGARVVFYACDRGLFIAPIPQQ